MLTSAVGTAAVLVIADPVAPRELWAAWSADPLVVGGLLAAGGIYTAGLRGVPRRPTGWRRASFWTGLVAIAGALVSPLEAAAGSLASAHMVQHVLLVLVAAPALAVAAPGAVLRRGTPPRVRRAVLRIGVAAGVGTRRTRRLWGPAAAWLLHAAVLWLWHARVLYEAALRNQLVHALEHLTMLGAALLLWGIVSGAHAARRLDRGHALLVVFAAGLHGVLLSALLTFARTPWYATYADSSTRWGLTPLADQQLAGVVLWAVGGVVHLGAALVLLAAWLQDGDGGPAGVRPRGGGQPGGHGRAV